MRTVRTKEELKQAIDAKEKCIDVVGELAKEISKAQKRKKGAKIGAGAALLASIAAAPLTGGTSLIAAGAVATGAAATAVSASTVVLVAIAAATGLSLVGLKKDYNVEIIIAGQQVRLTHK